MIQKKIKKTEKGRISEINSQIVFITGLSGSGKTVALRSLEDLDFFCVDNLPVSLVTALVSKISDNIRSRNIAVGIDIREKEFLSDIDSVIKTLGKAYTITIIFLEAETDVLIRRFKETRRPHPLGGTLRDAIRSERRSLASLRKKADRIIETSSFTPHQLRKYISSIAFPKRDSQELTVSLISFGFKYGAPDHIDLLFDVRFLPNPNFIPTLKHLTGIDKAVSHYVLKHRESKSFMSKIKDLLDFLLPQYVKEGRAYLSIAVGCTGGNHRSPAIIEAVAKHISKKNREVRIVHRDISS
ncbi:MAG: RNase adapter RapZ [Nitrospiraceae bacterium]|nr:MAG: RNase adapter RapZ [Nitrospiraceae bacterium]